MSKEASVDRKVIGGFAPKMVELTDNLLFDDAWEGPASAVVHERDENGQ